MAEVTPVAAASTAESDIAKLKADLAVVKADLSKADSKATSWLAANAHAFVTGTLVLAVLFILHKIL
jgi:hypothetical protein